MSIDILRDCVAELIDGWGEPGDQSLMGRVAQLLPEQTATGQQEGKAHKKISGSPAPWNDHAALLWFDIHGGARGHEKSLMWVAFSRRPHRPGSDLHTRKALRQLPDLIAHVEQAFPRHPFVEDATKDLMGWPRRCRALLDEVRAGEEPVTYAPGRLVCPHCDRRLILKPGWQYDPAAMVFCTHCVDGQRQPLSWPASAWLGVLQEGTP